MATSPEPQQTPNRRQQVDDFLAENRILVLVLGSLFGLGLVLASGALAYRWWDKLTGGMQTWHSSEGWRIWLCLFMLLSGLGIMFASLQLGRVEERSNPLLRRMLYGFNAVLGGLLLLAILVFVNILAGLKLSAASDWTTQNIYTLSSRSEQILQGLAKPTKIYVIMARGGQMGEDTYRRVQALMDNARSVNDRIEVKYLSPDLPSDREEVNQLRERYQFSDREGLLVLYGTEPRVDHQFISATALYTSPGGSFMASQDKRYFQGESQLMTALDFLEQGKEKPVLYFTQGNGELDINDATSGDAPGVGAGVLKQRLEADNYTVKGLALSPVEGARAPNPGVISATQVPDDAAFVAVVRPQRMPKYALDAVDKYMKGAKDGARRGRLVVLLDPPSTSQPDEAELAEFVKWLTGFNVKVGQNRVLTASLFERFPDVPRVVRVVTNPELKERNPIAAAFADRPFLWFNVRTVDPVTTGTSPDSRFQAQTLLQVPPEDVIWAETNLRTPPIQFLARNRFAELKTKLASTPLSVGVVVTESTNTDPHARMMGQAEDNPCLAVYGSASYVSNAYILNEGALGQTYDLFASTLGWLRKRPEVIGIAPKKQDVYQLNTANLHPVSMAFFPMVYMVVGILGLGTGIWVVRRR